MVLVESFQEVGEVVCGELPLEGLRCLVVTGFEGGEPFHDDIEIIEVVVRDHFALNNGEEDLVG